MTIAITADKIEVTIPYADAYARDYIKAAPDGRRWDDKRKLWVLQRTLDNMLHVRNLPGEKPPELDALIVEASRPLSVAPGVADKLDAYLGMHGLTKPFAHQRRGLELLVSNPRAALHWEQGTGKTWPTLHLIRYEMLCGNVERTLIVCPKSAIGSWLAQAEEHTDMAGAITVIGGTATKRRKQLEHGSIVLINYDLLRWMQPELLAAGLKTLVFDEAHYIKTTNASRSRVAYLLSRQATRVVQLTGTPASQGPGDIFGQYKVLDLGETFGTIYSPFQYRYFHDLNAGTRRNWPDWQPKPEMFPGLQAKIARRAWRLTKADCLDLPAKNYQTLTVEMTADQTRVYREMLRGAAASLADGQEITADVAAAVFAKLTQITSGFIYDEQHRAHWVSDAKLKLMREQVEDKAKSVVWCQYTADIDAVCAAVGDLGVVRMDGSVSAEDRAERIERFQTDPECRVFVGQISTGIGVTLTAAQHVVYFSQGFRLVDRQQSEDRTHRIGTTGVVTYVDLVCEGTVDEVVIASQRKKRTVAGVLTGDIRGDVIAAVRAAVDEYREIKEARRR